MTKNELETCIVCNSLTGRAGKGEDSLYFGDIGPFCDSCHATIEKSTSQPPEADLVGIDGDFSSLLETETLLAHFKELRKKLKDYQERRPPEAEVRDAVDTIKFLSVGLKYTVGKNGDLYPGGGENLLAILDRILDCEQTIRKALGVKDG